MHALTARTMELILSLLTFRIFIAEQQGYYDIA